MSRHEQTMTESEVLSVSGVDGVWDLGLRDRWGVLRRSSRIRKLEDECCGCALFNNT